MMSKLKKKDQERIKREAQKELEQIIRDKTLSQSDIECFKIWYVGGATAERIRANIELQDFKNSSILEWLKEIEKVKHDLIMKIWAAIEPFMKSKSRGGIDKWSCLIMLLEIEKYSLSHYSKTTNNPSSATRRGKHET